MSTLLLGLGLNLTLAVAALARRALTPAGALAGLAVGFGLYWSDGTGTWPLLALFFVSSTALSRVGRLSKEDAESLTGKGDRRDAVQVLANGGPALLMGLAWRLSGEPAFAVGAAAALAAATADTWASEIGLLSRRPPVSLIGLRPVDRGRSGGVTPLGLAASLGGSALIAAAMALTCRVFGGCPTPTPTAALIVAGCGFFGSILDSLLGSTLQGRFADAAAGAYTERRRSASGVENRLTGGMRLITNDAVNLLSGLAASGLAVLLARGLV